MSKLSRDCRAKLPILLFASLLAPSRALAQATGDEHLAEVEEEVDAPKTVPSGHRLAFGLRTGYGLPSGKASASGSELSGSVAGVVPIGFDFGVLWKSGVYLGVFGQYGFGVLGSDVASSCDAAERQYDAQVSCGAYAGRGGLELGYHFGRGASPSRVDPWVGIGTGLEWVGWDYAIEGGGEAATISSSASGFEYASVHAGLDFPLADWFAVGPYATAAMGEYKRVTLSCEGDCGMLAGSRSGDITDSRVHSWFFFGVRALFLPVDLPRMADTKQKR